ncbi:Dyp-type peroxidase [Methyloglobulus sp.]|uniref:Dyp-type peroxidase n=1 Tax=Methyloglobulus sp. TaxID=2518622 RepID=UPI003989AE33
MKNSSEFEFDDLQGLIRFGYGKLTDTCFLLLNVADKEAAKQWLNSAPVSNAVKSDKQPSAALACAFTVEGLRAMGLKEPTIESFSDEFITGLSGDESRSRRLGDVDANAPENWIWGGKAKQIPHVLLLLYALPDGIENWRKKVVGKNFSKAFKILATLPTEDIGQIEPFGFADGISQPSIDWQRQQSTNPHDRDRYSNLMAVGEVLLGYPNEYKQYTVRPLIDPGKDKNAAILPNAEDKPKLKDFGRNGAYLVLRQLGQDVPGFWKFVDTAAGSVPKKREQIAAAMVGRSRDGSPLVPEVAEDIPGIPTEDRINHFTYDADAGGDQCPIGAHIRRTNPRTGDLPLGVTDFVSWLKKTLGFGQSRLDEDLVASSRFHRLLRRGRTYGPKLAPEDAIKPDAPAAERGIQFICLVANISRQFEFVQNAWVMSSKFSGLQKETDPLLGHRKPLMSGEATAQFNRPNPDGVVQKTCPLPQFITVRGGGYFFMPGLRALKYIAAQPTTGSDNKS